MSDLSWTIAAMAAVTYGARAWGLGLPTTRPRGFARRFLDHVPAAVFAGLAASGLPGAGPVDGAWRLAAATVTVLVVARTRALAPGLLAGLMLYLAARALGWA